MAQSRMILLLEDEPVLRHLMGQVLVESGFGVLGAGDGRGGLELAKAYCGTFALVVTDIGMPLMDGLEFARRFRLLYPTVPILFTTGFPEQYRSGTFSNCELLQKPYGPDRLLAAVHRLVSGSNDARTASG